MDEAVPTRERAALPPGARVDRYRVEALLGAGGFGITYLARERDSGRPVALKEYFPAQWAFRAAGECAVQVDSSVAEPYRCGLDRFLQQAAKLASFGHPHVVSVIGAFEANRTAYMAMEYEQGESLGHLLKQVHTLPEERLRAIAMPLLDALRAIHEAGFLHGDIKPSNVFLREQGGPMLIDFGEARCGGRAASAATPGYAALEQYAGEGEGPWSDIYALAAVCLRAITGDDPPEARARKRRDPVPGALAHARERYGAQWLACIGWGLELDARRRPQSAQAWMDAFEGGAVLYRLRGDPRKARRRAARKDTSAPYRWAVPIAVALAVVAWRVYDRPQPLHEATLPSHETPAGAAQTNHAARPSATLVGTVRERPSRERTGRPGREP